METGQPGKTSKRNGPRAMWLGKDDPDDFKVKWFNCKQLPREMAAILQQESTEDVSIPVDEDEEVTYGEMMYGADEYDSE